MISRREALGAAAMTAIAAAAPAVARDAAAEPATDLDHLIVHHRKVGVDGVEIFYREAGRRNAPAILLLHGFPSSSHMFRHLIPALADRYRLVAPDYPGFGFSQFPAADEFDYSFGNYARLMGEFADAVGLDRFALYIQDYGAPIGLRLALARSRSITALITQNGNAYEEGLSAGWDPLKAYWRDPTPQRREQLKGWLGADGLRLQYTAGVRGEQLERLAPDTWALDWAHLSRPGNEDIQIGLFGDYRHNVALYPEIQAWFRQARPPTLVLWGKNDPFFTVAGALAFRRDLPQARVELLDGSHFLLETHGPQCVAVIRDFLASAIQ
jgi:pimeloyl-ACP methyl ester carboxylesterase